MDPERERIQADLRGLVKGDVRCDDVFTQLYACDASIYEIIPAGVVMPRDIDDCVAVVKACREHGVPIVPRGAGTGLTGGAVGSGLQVDLSRHMNAVLDLDLPGRRVRVQPGVVLDELNAQLAPHGLQFAPDVATSSRATVGGMIANNSSGARSIVYGKTIDHVMELEVLLSDGTAARFGPVEAAELERLSSGASLEARCYREVQRLAREHEAEIARRYPKVLRRVGGYNLDAFAGTGEPFNLAKLIVGSEGTLAVVAEATVNLVPLPVCKAVLVVQFADLFEALQKKEIPAIRSLTKKLPRGTREALSLLPELYGGPEVLALAMKRLPGIAELRKALATLRALARACPVPASFDLAELRGYHYHSGVVFDAYCEGKGAASFPIARGGRYDEVGKAFGRARPATGFSIDLRSLANA